MAIGDNIKKIFNGDEKRQVQISVNGVRTILNLQVTKTKEREIGKGYARIPVIDGNTLLEMSNQYEEVIIYDIIEVICDRGSVYLRTFDLSDDDIGVYVNLTQITEFYSDELSNSLLRVTDKETIIEYINGPCNMILRYNGEYHISEMV